MLGYLKNNNNIIIYKGLKIGALEILLFLWMFMVSPLIGIKCFYCQVIT